MKNEKSSPQSEALKSPCANAINTRLEECLIYVRNKYKLYTDTHDLALDFGKYGTRKFFPLPLLIGLIEEDERFSPYLAHFGEKNISDACSNWDNNVN